MPRVKRMTHLLWYLMLLLIAVLILLLTALFPKLPVWADKILWIVFGYLLSNVLNFVLGKVKPSGTEPEEVLQLSSINQKLDRMESKLDKISKKLE